MFLHPIGVDGNDAQFIGGGLLNHQERIEWKEKRFVFAVRLRRGIVRPNLGDIKWESIRIYPGADGFWYRSCQGGVPLTAYAIALQPSKAGVLHAEYKEYEWKDGDPPVPMISKDDGFCFLSGVGGKFEGDGEHVWVEIDENGIWSLGGSCHQTVRASAVSVRILSAE